MEQVTDRSKLDNRNEQGRSQGEIEMAKIGKLIDNLT